VVILDADLQDPPELIETFVARWREGYKNVFAQRVDRTVYTPLRRILTRRFYKLFGSIGDTRLPEGGGDFRLLDTRAVAALRTMREHARFSKGLYAWIGFRSIGVPFDVEARVHGVSKFSYRKLTHLALDGLMSFSTMPLKVWSYIGLTTSLLALSFDSSTASAACVTMKLVALCSRATRSTCCCSCAGQSSATLAPR